MACEVERQTMPSYAGSSYSGSSLHQSPLSNHDGTTIHGNGELSLNDPEEEVIDLYAEYDKDMRRGFVNQEFMIFHGNDPSRYLPPLPQQERPKSSLAVAWSCNNPAMRQLGNLSRRGPRKQLPGSATSRRPALISPELRRPQTAYTSQVNRLINTKYDQVKRPTTSGGKLETMPFRQKFKPLENDQEVLITPKRLPAPPPPEDLPDVEPLHNTPGGGFRRPGRHRTDSPRKTGDRKGGNVYPNMEKKRLEDLSYLMKGNYSHLPPDIPTTVRIYLAGTKQDFLKEREVLDQEVLPVLREFCENQGVELDLLDMGVSDGEVSDLKSNFYELDKCQSDSLGPFYVLLLGDYASPLTLPPDVPVADFDVLLKMTTELKVENKDLFKLFYKRDNNCIPPKYILQVEELKNTANVRLLMNLWQNLLGIAEQAGKFTPDKRQKYEAKPVVEHEVSRIFQMFTKGSASKTSGINCLCFHRSFKGLTDTLEEGSVVPQYTNIYEDPDSLSFDHEAQRRLRRLKDIIGNYLPEENSKAYQLPWTGAGIDWQNSDEHQAYLNSFIEDFIEGVKKLVLHAKEQWKIKNRNGNLYGELLEQARCCLYHVKAFSGRAEELARVQAFMSDSVMNQQPFVIHGAPGVGKSSLISAVAKHSKEWLSKHCVTVFRYLGLTPKSSDLKQTLVSLCIQICAIYNMDSPPEADHHSVNKMVHHFSHTLEIVSKHHAAKKPLVLLLDGLERLGRADRADTLSWLPRSVPGGVHLLLTLTSDSRPVMARLRKRVTGETQYLQLNDFIQSDLPGVVDSILKCSHRILKEEQKSSLLSRFSSYCHPLYVRTLCTEATRWRSDDHIAEHGLAETTSETVVKMTYKLEDIYGVKFVQKIMSYLCLLSEGITEKELCDLMCSDQEVLQDIYTTAKYNENEVQVFDSISKNIRSLLRHICAFLRRSYIYGRHLIQWNSELYRETCAKKFFGATNPFTGKNDNIDDTLRKVNNLFSAEKPLTLKINGAGQSNLSYIELKCPTMPYHLNPAHSRKLEILPKLITHSGSEVDFSKQLKDTCLCYYAWLLNKLQAFTPDEVLEDFRNITERDIEIDCLVSLLEIAKPGLKPDPKTFPLQLLGCMPYLDEDYPLLNQMLVEAQTWVDSVSDSLLLLPLFPAFPSPTSLVRARLWGAVELLSIEASGRLGVLRNETGYIEIWDLENKEFVKSLGIRVDRVQPNVFTSATHVLGLSGAELTVWEIESQAPVQGVMLESLLGKHVSTMSIFCYSPDFSLVTIHTSDEDFAQSLVVVDVAGKRVHSVVEGYDVKDEFFKDSAVFAQESSKMVYVMARSEVVGDNKSADFLKVNIYHMDTKEVEYTLECGEEKKFNRILLQDDCLAIVSWKDCSFDVYDIDRGVLKHSLLAPDSRLTIEDCCLTEDNYLVGLSSSLPTVNRKYYALWFWNVDEQTSVNLLTHRYDKIEEVPRMFVIIEELHIAILGCTDSTNLSIWDLPNSELIYTGASHTEGLDSICKTKDPYQIYTSSNSEEVVKLWDLYDIIRKAKEDKAHKSKSNRAKSVVTDVSSVRSLTTDGILRRKKKKALRKSKSVRFVDDSLSVVSDDMQSTKGSEFTEDFDLSNLPKGKDEDLGNPGRDENVFATQLETMVGATHISFAQDGSYLILSTDRSLPTMWEMNNGHVIKRLEPHDDHDLATPWAEMCCNDEAVVGLTLDENTRDITPLNYKYQTWNLNSGEPMHKGSELQLQCVVCAVSMERDRAVLCCVDGEVGGGGGGAITTIAEEDENQEEAEESHTSGPKHSLVFRILDIRQHVVLQTANYSSPAVPTQIQLMDDCSYCVADYITKPGETNQGFLVYHLEVNADLMLKPEAYEYMEGDKYKEYRATANVVLPSGQLSLSTGLNGDMQVWDITSCEYEGNLYCDPSVKDTRNPSLHNHGGRRVLHVAVSEDGAYLLCAGADGGTSVWDLENEVNVFSYGGHSSEVLRVAISRDNQIVLTAGADMLINVWKLSVVDRPLCRLYVHSTVTHMHISSDNKSVAVIGTRRNEAPGFMLFQLKNAPEPLES